jgi:hypothetical protein
LETATLQNTSDTRPSARDPKRLTRLRAYLDANEIDWESYLVNLLKGLAPPPIVFGEGLYLDRSDEVAFRSRLRAESLKRAAELARLGGEHVA